MATGRRPSARQQATKRLASATLLAAVGLGAVAPWGEAGHEMAARAATEVIPDAMPAFFHAAADQLVYLNPEPDRWRERTLREMDQAFQYDHYIDLENVPGSILKPDGLEPRSRFAFLRVLYQANIPRPEQSVGFLPYRIAEMYQRTVASWRRWRTEDDPTRRRWTEERIVADAGIMGHYVTDASQPHHTTIHFNGWDEDTPNPHGYTRDNGVHSRFESAFVGAHVTLEDVRRHQRRDPPPSVVGSVREAVFEHIMAAHNQVETLYQIERDVGFAPDAPPAQEAREFAAQRLAAGADMLATLWWSAWLESAPEQ